LTEPERVLFRRLAVFLGGFDLDAAQAVAGGGDVERYQVLDQLTLLVDKSLVAADDSAGRTRYRLLETVRQYAAEKLGESGEADAVRTRHRDHYTSMAAVLDAPAGTDYEQRIEQANSEIDNLRAAFAWSRETSSIEQALGLASSLQPLWQARGRFREGLAWFDAALTDDNAQHEEVAAAVRARALADSAVLAALMGTADSLNQAQQALAIAREVDDPGLLVRALTACGIVAGQSHNAEVARACFAEAIGLARAVDDRWRLSQILALQALGAHTAGDLLGLRAAGEEGRDLADAIGDGFNSRVCRFCLGAAQMMSGDLAGAVTQLGEVATEAEAAHDEVGRVISLGPQSLALAYRGEAAAARAAAEAALEGGAELGGRFAALGHAVVGIAALAAGDGAAVHEAREAARQDMNVVIGAAAGLQRVWNAEAALADRDLAAARRWAEEAVSTTTGSYSAMALTIRARVAIAAGEPDQAERDAHDALGCAAEVEAYLAIPDILECLAALPGETGSHREAARLFATAEAIRQRMGAVRFKVWDAGYEASVAALRNALGEKDFDFAWAEGAALSTEEAIAYAQRGRGQRKRPTSGWASLTPTERDVVRFVSDGLANKDIATRLFVSPRTVQTHLTHVYTKLGLNSRVQLVQEAARHA
jgi:DNA-binding CsgD family transcriptional regulator/tetratricopeptide (TPR) repeat protein